MTAYLYGAVISNPRKLIQSLSLKCFQKSNEVMYCVTKQTESYNLKNIFVTNFLKSNVLYILFLNGSLQVDGITNGPLKVCFSRKNEFPGANSTGDTDTQCQQISGTSYTYKLSDPCEGCEYLSQCPPLHISVASIGKVQSLNCIGKYIINIYKEYKNRNKKRKLLSKK